MRKFSEVIMVMGGCILILGALSHITGWSLAPYVYSFGAVLFVPAQLSDRYHGKNIVIRRLKGQQSLGAAFILVTGVLMFSDSWHMSLLLNSDMNHYLRAILLSVTKRNMWIVTLTIAAFFELYTSFRIESELKKEE